MTRPHDYLVIYIRPSLQGSDQPVTAFLGGTPLEARGGSVWTAVNELMSMPAVLKIARKLEVQIENALEGIVEDRRAR
jgi:hypothetical protein